MFTTFLLQFDSFKLIFKDHWNYIIGYYNVNTDYNDCYDNDYCNYVDRNNVHTNYDYYYENDNTWYGL